MIVDSAAPKFVVMVGKAELGVTVPRIALAPRVTVVSGESCAMTVAKKADTNSDMNMVKECRCAFAKSRRRS